MPTPYIGEIKLVPFNYPPKGWAFCNGQLLPINQNQALFALLGTTYGGDGQTTFALPNLQSRTIVHQGQGSGLSPYNWGQQFGAQPVTLTVDQIPPHNHGLNVSSAPGNVVDPTNNHLAVASTTIGTTYDAATTGAMPNAVQNAGGQGHENRQPYLTLNYVIALTGIFPPRN